MQTIARANRVAEGKTNGLIVDYVGIVKALEKALTDYTQNVNGTHRVLPTVDKEELIKRICEANDAEAINSILRELQKKRKPLDNTNLLVEIHNIINESVEVDDEAEHAPQMDISKIDFKLLSAEFKRVKHKNLLIKNLENLVQYCSSDVHK